MLPMHAKIVIDGQKGGRKREDKKKKKARAAAETLDKRRSKWKAGLATEVDRVIGSPRRKV